MSLTVLLIAAILQAQPSVTALNELAAKLQSEGKFSEAKPLYEHALTLCSADCEQYPTILNNLGSLYFDTRKYADAEQLLDKAVKLAPTASNLRNLAAVYNAQAHYSRAAVLYEQALQLREQTAPNGGQGLPSILNAMARTYQSLGQYKKTEELARRSLSILASNGMQTSPDGETALLALAVACKAQDRLPEAEDLYRRVLREAPDSSRAAAAMNNLGSVVLQQGRWQEARDLYTRAIGMWEKDLGPNQPEVASGLTNLATLYQSRREYGKAASLLDRAVQIDTAAFPPDHPRIALDWNNRAALAVKKKQYAEAESMLARSLRMLEKNLPPDHPDIGVTASNLAEVYHFRHHYGDAIWFYRKGLKILEQAWGPDDRRLLSYFEDYALALRARNEFAEAAQADLRAVRIRVVHTLR